MRGVGGQDLEDVGGPLVGRFLVELVPELPPLRRHVAALRLEPVLLPREGIK